jgi:hypothetical protein
METISITIASNAKTSKRREIIKIRAKINEMETKKKLFKNQ